MNPSASSSSSLKSFNVLEKLGEGSFASVYKVQRIDDKKLYAMKKVKISEMREKERDNALNQVRVLASISHANIVNYKEAFYDDTTQSLCIVMELADAGDIQKKVQEHIKNHSHFTESEIWGALIQMSKGLKALHQINILHRDLKCANVFCTKDQKYKLGDLNVSKVAKKGMARTQTGTPYYTSPEVWKDRPYDSKCDIWSLGCVIYEMASLNPPFKANNLKELYTKIQKGIFHRIPSFYSDDLAEIINLCLKVNPSQRPSAAEILQSPKVSCNTPSSERYIVESKQMKKANLIGTILCPRNLKSLKMALPGAKYQEMESQRVRQSSVDGERQIQRAISCRSNNFSKPVQIQRVLNSPKVGQMMKKEIKYSVLQRRPSSSDRNVLPLIVKKEAYSELRERQNSRNSRNNVKVVRNNSVDSLRRRQDSNRSIENARSRIKQQRDVEIMGEQDKAFANEISSKCRNIQERMELLIKANQNSRNERERYQKVSNSYEKNNMPQPIWKDRRENSSKSRNNSIEMRNAPNNNLVKQLSKNVSQRSLERNRSIERIQRPNSRRIFEMPKYLPYRR